MKYKITAIMVLLFLGCFGKAERDDRVQRSNAGNQIADALPPYTDYCDMLSQEIQGRKHAFLAGNLVYYVGGQYHCWDHAEDETLGLTHPFHHDLRGRGFGITTHKGSGTGHDFKGWEFYTQTRIAYGTVIIKGKEYPYPAPTSMKWRPDKVICEYVVGGVKIHEEKFVAENDVVCSVIRSEVPVTLRFDGRSLMINNLSMTNTSKVQFDAQSNAVHISEGGTVKTHPVVDRNDNAEGRLIYDGMSTVLSSSKKLTNFTTKIDDQKRRLYSFQIPCDREGVVLTWAMDDVYAKALARTRDVLSDTAGQMQAKTKKMNDLLNYQIPYFRCSDSDIVDIYYYLWSIYLMYYIDVDQGWEQYPHTQSAQHTASTAGAPSRGRDARRAHASAATRVDCAGPGPGTPGTRLCPRAGAACLHPDGHSQQRRRGGRAAHGVAPCHPRAAGHL